MPRGIAALAAPLVLAAAAGAQDVPTSRVELVRLDVVVTDGRDQLVRGLSQDDFVVLEDGKPQRLTHFVAAGRTPKGAASPSPGPDAPAGPQPVPVPAPAGPSRTIVILVDDLHIAASSMEPVKQSLLRMLDEFVAADDQVALIGTGSDLLVQPTLDRAVLRGAIGRLVARPLTVQPESVAGSSMTPLQAEMVLAGDPAALRLVSEQLLANPANLTANAPLTLPDRQRTAENEVQRQARAILAESLRISSATLGTLADVLRSLAPRTGRKICLLVSDGFQVGTGTSEDRRADLRRIIDASLRSGSVVYALTSTGLITGIADASMPALNTPPGLDAQVQRRGEMIVRETLERVAEDTGGFVVRGNNDLAGGLRRMLDDNEVYYLMAYEPANKRREGRFRRIEVRVAHREGLKVRTRKGYLEPDDRQPGPLAAAAHGAPAPEAADPSLGETEARGLLSHVSGGGMAVRLTADWFELPPSGPRAVVRAHLDLSRVFWQEAQGRHRAEIEIVGGVYDAAGKPVGAVFGKRAALDLVPGDQERVVRSGLQYQEVLPLAPGRYEVRLVAHERGVDLVGGATQWLEVPDLSAGTLAVSSLFLSTSAPAAGQNAQAAEEGLRDVQTQRRFKADQSLYFQLYVYNATRDDQRQADVVLQAQLRSGGALVAASPPQPAALQEKDGVPLPETNGMPLQGLAAGPYELRVVVVDRKANVSAARSVDFTVE